MISPLIELCGIKKSFGQVCALKELDFTLNSGEIVALLGDNGAGKSTLIKILAGFHRSDSGTFLFEGKAVNFKKHSVAQARQMGIETVYQDKSLGDGQSLWRNLFMGRHLKTPWGLIDVRKERAVVAELLANLGLAELSPDTPAGLLSGGERQGLAIGRAIHFQAKVVILDEPTTALAIGEVEKTLEFIKKVKEQGRSVIFITHNLEQAWNVADRFVIMSQGRLYGDCPRSELTFEELLQILRKAAR